MDSVTNQLHQHKECLNKNNDNPNTKANNSTEINQIKALSSFFIHSILQGVSLNDIVNEISDNHPIPSSSSIPQKQQKHHKPVSVNTSLTQTYTSPSKNHYNKTQSQTETNTKIKTSTSNKDYDNGNNDAYTEAVSVLDSYKVSSETEKKRKLYEDKAKAMQNRLNALKKQEEILMKKMNAFNSKEKEMNQIKSEKKAFKNALQSIKSIENSKLQEQQQKNNQLKDEVHKGVKESLSQIRIKKHAEYELARTEKQLVTAMINNNMEQIENYNLKKIERIKSGYERYKNEAQRRQKENETKMKQNYIQKSYEDTVKTDQLKGQLEEMEKMEEHYLNSLMTSKKKMIKKGVNYNNYANKMNVHVSIDEKYPKKSSSQMNSIDYNNNNTIDNDKNIQQKLKNKNTMISNAKTNKLIKKGYSRLIDKCVEIEYNPKRKAKQKTIHQSDKPVMSCISNSVQIN